MDLKNRPKLNKIEEKVWVALLEFVMDNFRTPTREELAWKLSDRKEIYSPQLIQYHLKKIEKKRYIKIVPLKKGGIKII